MKTFDGYSKEKFSDTSVLLAGGGSKELSNFIGTLNWDSTNRKLQYKKIGDTNWNDLVTFGSHAFVSTDYYWANVKVSTSSNAATTPTFATATATTSVITPLVSSTGRLTLNATNTALDLLFNNDETKSVVLNGSEFKPFNEANGKLDLGSTSARWKTIYGGSGNFTGNVTM